MGIFSRITGWRRGHNSQLAPAAPALPGPDRRRRRPLIESVEPRRMMAADILLGSVYFEEATGDDTAADVIQITFQGGAAGTTLDRLVINGDKTGDGPSAGDVFYDIAAGGLGAFHHVGLTIEGQDGFEITGVTVVDGGSQIVFDLEGFEAGEVLIFSVDADEIQFMDSAALSGGALDPDLIDTNPLVEGAEFQRSILTGEFSAPRFEDVTLEALYWDVFDTRFAEAQGAAEAELGLPNDRYEADRDYSDRTAGAITHVAQTPLPTIAGTVFHDVNLDNSQDPSSDAGIAGVGLELWKFDTTVGDYVATGIVTLTNGQGEYLFEDTGGPVRLLPGRYQIREVQPPRYYSVGARAGTIDGETVGVVLDPDTISEIDLPRAANSIDNDFAEALPAAISGHVYADDNQDGDFQPGSEEGIGGVQVRVVPVSTVDGSSLVVTVTTDDNGFWSAGDLVPGEYRVEEVATPEGYIDGLDAAGTVNGVTVGHAINPGDEIVDVLLGGDQSGIDYDFGEVRLGSIAGRVHLSTDGDCEFEPTDFPLEGVQVDLLDAAGNLLTTTYTDAKGEYVFVDLAPREYIVREHTPTEFQGRRVFDGDEHVGSAGGEIIANDTIGGILLAAGENATDYDFCENVGANISGWVYHDANNNGVRDAGEEGIGDVALELLDSNGNPTGVTTTTSASGSDIGYYEFLDFAPGTWGVREVQPSGWIDGRDAAGTHGGTAENPGDRITGAVLTFASFGKDYNFGELLPASLSGMVQASTDGSCDFENPEILLAGVRIDLLDAGGNLVAATLTDDAGLYEFTGLAPGEYQVFEHQPAEHEGRKLFDGGEHVGDAGGEISANDTIRQIVLGSGQVAREYNFCEHIGAMLSGWVYHDRDNDGVREPGEEGIGGVTLMLLDARMSPTGHTVTTSTHPGDTGFYKFNDLPPGTYGVMEVQPAGWLDGIDAPGSLGGIAEPSPPGDKIHSFALEYGRNGTDYNFGELLPASIRGSVHVTTDPLCIPQPGEPSLAGVTIELLNADGRLITSTITDNNGEYVFDNLRPGYYTVREIQPTEYFDAGAHVGSGGGSVLNSNTLADVEVRSGDDLVDYDFCENPAASISGYVFQDGPPILTISELPNDIATVRDGRRTADDRPIGGVVLELRQGASGDPIFGYQALPAVYAVDQPIRTVTDASGHYDFRGLPGGTYAVVEVHPDGVIDGIDTQGSTGGFAVNPPVVKTETVPDAEPGLVPNLSPQRVIEQFRTEFGNDAIVLIPLQFGQTSVENNFSEVTTQPFWLPPGQAPPAAAPPVAPPLLANPSPTFVPLISPEIAVQSHPSGSRVRGYTWHLSVVDGGFPRAVDSATSFHRLSTQFNVSTWQGTVMDEAVWTLPPKSGLQAAEFQIATEEIRFGNRRAKPVAGDFNGDGVDEIGVFIDGEWHIDINGNRRWDENDLWAKLGTQGDLPAVGDWDGDGKTDIGIFGPAWPLDPLAVHHEPGLPDPENTLIGKHKNMPPEKDEASGGERVMQRTARGDMRAHLIDHVFHYGAAGDAAVVGDWNGDGIATIGVFRHGVWRLDVDGDGRFTSADIVAEFGVQDDLPLVGDFNGDGIDEIGVYRAGEWLLDTHRDYQFDSKDEVHRLGGAGDLPVVGDWDGDGTDSPAVLHPDAGADRITRRPHAENES